MKTYKDFINKAKPVELDELAATAIATSPLWAPTLTAKLTATALAAYKLFKGGQTFKNMFNKAETIDDLNKLDGFWKDTKTNNTNIADPIGKDVYNPGNLQTDKIDKTNTQVGDTTAAIPGAIPDTNVGAKAITNTNVGSKVRTRTRALAKPFRLPNKLPRMPGTGHNVGRRVNPQ